MDALTTDDIEAALAALAGADRVWSEEFTEATRQAALVAAGGVKMVSPLDKGRLRSSIVGELVEVTGESVSAVIGTNVTANGFPYPRALNESGRYHYRAGPRRGEPTQGYFERGIASQEEVLAQVFDAAAERLVERLAEA